jgi:hypothetical protein
MQERNCIIYIQCRLESRLDGDTLCLRFSRGDEPDLRTFSVDSRFLCSSSRSALRCSCRRVRSVI